MILIPELKKVVLCPPKTASTTLRKAIEAEYPKAMVLYCHGEANMIPPGYDSWEKVGLIRNPLDRLFSLYSYCRDFSHPNCALHSLRMRDSVQQAYNFSDWILENSTLFSFGFTGASIPSPRYLTGCTMPETRKPQTLTLRPDLGTKVWLFEDIVNFSEMLGLDLAVRDTPPSKAPHIRKAAQRHMDFYFESDYKLIGELADDI